MPIIAGISAERVETGDKTKVASNIRISTKKFKPRDVWRQCLDDPSFLQKHKISDEDRRILEDFSPLGGVKAEGDVLFILDTIRWARGKK